GKGEIRLCWRLIHFPPELVDYVVAHELAHLKEMNHSPRFWAEVETLYPDWRRARTEIRRLAQTLPEIAE
ncbi:MAG: M48 family metallopeptidase, partial [Zoogloeaceae bacterium]|nr:M48 family metallopeptidase [Zoogloeaceae bacterium]